MADVEVGVRAYCKILLHVAKYPHCAVNGILLAEKPKNKEPRVLKFVDAIPLFHMSLSLAPMLEVALTQADTYCKSQGLVIGGYYHANENLNDTKPSYIAQKVADKLHEYCEDSCLFMVQNEKLSRSCTDEALDLYTNQDGKWKQKVQSELLESGSLEVASSLLCSKAYRSLVDFDNHLDDITLDWQNLDINEQLKLSS